MPAAERWRSISSDHPWKCPLTDGTLPVLLYIRQPRMNGQAVLGGSQMPFRLIGPFILCFLLTGCALLFNNRSVSKPPRDPVEAQKWWIETVDTVDVSTLRCWYRASEIHRERGSSVMYFFSWSPGLTMAGPWYCDYYYPTPIPKDVLPRIEARLAKEKPQDDKDVSGSREWADWITVKTCKNCTEQEALVAWKE
jgi:hypothetical protein